MKLIDKATFRLWAALSSISLAVPHAFAILGFENSDVGNLPGDSAVSFGDILKKIIVFVLDLTALIAVAFIIIAGIRLIVSQGEEEQKEKAKKSILYAIIGLIVILLARVFVGFVTGQVPGILGLS